jgi:hypothetical protein
MTSPGTAGRRSGRRAGVGAEGSAIGRTGGIGRAGRHAPDRRVVNLARADVGDIEARTVVRLIGAARRRHERPTLATASGWVARGRSPTADPGAPRWWTAPAGSPGLGCPAAQPPGACRDPLAVRSPLARGSHGPNLRAGAGAGRCRCGRPVGGSSRKDLRDALVDAHLSIVRDMTRGAAGLGTTLPESHHGSSLGCPSTRRQGTNTSAEGRMQSTGLPPRRRQVCALTRRRPPNSRIEGTAPATRLDLHPSSDAAAPRWIRSTP